MDAIQFLLVYDYDKFYVESYKFPKMINELDIPCFSAHFDLVVPITWITMCGFMTAITQNCFLIAQMHNKDYNL